MTAAVALPEVDARPAPVLQGYRFELVKLLSQWRIRLVLLACWIAPALFVIVVSQQSALPVDTVFGRWMHATGWSGSLVVLGFSGTWALPLLTALVAGDAFAVEDRLGTWRHLMVAVRSPRRIFAAKALASLTVLLLLVAGLTVSSVVGGLAAVGNHPLVGLDGHILASGDAAARVLLAWVCVLAPTLAFAAVGLLGSVAFGRNPMGLLMPALLAFVLQLAQMLPLPVSVRMALPSHAFLAWRGLFTDPTQADPLVIGLGVSLAWAVIATVLAYLLFLRRDFTDLTYDGSGRRVLAAGGLPLAGLVGLTVVVIGAATPAQGSGIEQAKVEDSLATTFAHLYVLQTEQLNRPAVTVAQLRATAACNKGGNRILDEGDGVVDEGPGNDWRCIVTWHLPGTSATGHAIYQLQITPDGRYIADGDGPKEVNGYFQVRTPTGDAPNPLFQLDGNVDLLVRSPKG
jgi:ABC-2 type transport system permease protein